LTAAGQILLLLGAWRYVEGPTFAAGALHVAASSRSTYSKHPHKEPWVLSKVTGEPLSWDPLEAISPEHPPEAIVAAQVQALK
jgi:hypothetical protein